MALAAVASEPAQAAPSGVWSGGIRVQSSAGEDSNVLEALEAPATDGFIRLFGEGHLLRGGLPARTRVDLSARLLGERYSRFPHEDRVQDEIRLALESSGLPHGDLLHAEGGYASRQYPDSTSRNHRRAWGRASIRFPLGPQGTMEPRFEWWSLDFRDTPRTDQRGTDFDLRYAQPLSSRLSMELGFQIGGVHHGLPSIQVVQDEPGADWRPVLGPDRRDSMRRAHLGFWWRRFALIHMEYGLRSQNSNSIDAAVTRNELAWLVARALPFGFGAQFFGSLEHTSYHDPRLGAVMVLRSGDPEAGDDDNAVALRLARSFGRGWSAEARLAWYRNESLLAQSYYHKRVWTAGIGWDAGAPSPF